MFLSMKKLVFVVMFGALCFSASAQTRFSLGPVVGVGGTWIDNLDSKQGKTHGSFGLAMVFSATPNFGLGADIRYSFEGGKNKITNGGLVTAKEINLDYLRVPVRAILFLGEKGSRIRPKLSVGPTVGFLMGGKTNTTFSESNGNVLTSRTVNSKDVYNRFDVGLNAGAGLHYRLVKSTWLIADVGYYHGLRDIVENPSTNSSLKNRNLAVNLGVNFGL